MTNKTIKLIKSLKLHNILIIFGLILWFAETAYFGFNLTPKSTTEEVLDYFSLYTIVVGIIIGWINKPIINNITLNIDEEFFKMIQRKINDK